MQQNKTGGLWSLVFGDAEEKWRAFEKRPLAADPHKVAEIVSRNMKRDADGNFISESSDVSNTQTRRRSDP